MPEVILPCPNPQCGNNSVQVTNAGPSFWVFCHACLESGPVADSAYAAIEAWENLPRMSTIIAWQLQAAGAALALQRLMDAAQAMRDAQQAWGKLIGVDTDMRITPGINQAACTLSDAEDAFDDLLADVRNALEARNG